MLESLAKLGVGVGALLPPGSALLAYAGNIEGAGVAVSSVGGGVILFFACKYLFKLVKYKDEQHRREIQYRDEQHRQEVGTKNAIINSLMDDLRKASGKCKNCDFVKASNREFLDSRKDSDNG